jgi:glutaredoxin
VPVVTLYGKPGCHLCQEARNQLERMRAEVGFELEQVDVSLHPGLHRRYGERIPVVAVDGVELFEFFIDPEALRERLEWAP